MSKTKEITLVDVFNMVHPKVKHATPEQREAWKDLMEGKLVSFDTWETELSNAKDDEARKKALESLIREDKMGYMALLRNLNNLIKYDVNPTTIKRAISKLVDPDSVKKSRQLPFRFLTAYNNVKGNRELTDAIADAMDIAVSNVPELNGKTLIAVDCSGSMNGDPFEKASIFCATLLKANKSADVILVSNRVREVTISSKSTTVDISKAIIAQGANGGTDIGLVFNYALSKSKGYNRIIILSDNESWLTSAQTGYRNYVRASKEDPYIYPIDIQGYGTADVTGSRVFHLTGWSDRLLDFIGAAEKGNTLIKYIKNYEI